MAAVVAVGVAVGAKQRFESYRNLRKTGIRPVFFTWLKASKTAGIPRGPELRSLLLTC